METHGEKSDKHSNGRPAIARRSCDQCRSRKIGCDRGSPCSNCIAAKVECTFSAIVSHNASPRQRVLISAQYEKKIDGIARDIDGIKAILQGLNVLPDHGQPEIDSILRTNDATLDRSLYKQEHSALCGGESQWDHSGHIIDFVKAVVNDRDYKHVEPESSQVLSSLKKFLKALEEPRPIRNPGLPKAVGSAMPPLDAVVALLRWAKDHGDSVKTPWLPEILPREQFTEICQKVYFSVEDYSEVDFILANGYLSYTFFEHLAASGRQDYLEYCGLCRKNVDGALARLPLLLPASREVIAALSLGAFQAIEASETTKAWTFISTASNLCQTLGYHRSPYSQAINESERTAQERLFWTVYKLDKGLSFRLGRPSSFQDNEITLPMDMSDEPTRIAKVQGKIFDQLYSLTGLKRSDDERGYIVNTLANELRDVISETQTAISSTTTLDQTRLMYMYSNLVCQHSLLTQVLRAVPVTSESLFPGVSNECIEVARKCLDMHEQCISTIRGCKNDPFIIKRYINWAIHHTPFAPFNILFTRAVQLLDTAELSRLDRFAASLQTEAGPSSESPTHPHRLYQLLCQAARLYFDLNAAPPTTDQGDLPLSGDEFDFAQYGLEAGVMGGGGSVLGGNELSGWYYENQQIMNLLNDNVMY